MISHTTTNNNNEKLLVLSLAQPSSNRYVDLSLEPRDKITTCFLKKKKIAGMPFGSKKKPKPPVINENTNTHMEPILT
jgi:hypothetical protein